MDNELVEYLAIVEQKLQSLLQDIRNIKSRIEERHIPTFFTALTSDDHPNFKPSNMARNMGS